MDGSPYGGVSLSSPSAPSAPLAPGGPTGICETRGQPDPCLLTGQYSRCRTSTNVNESNPAAETSSNSITFQNLQVVPPVTASLTNIYSWNGQACSGSHFALTAWFTPSFREPALANGTVYVPMVCGVTGGKQSQYVNCGHVAYPASVTSGIAAFTTASVCP
jgi:hypothetical protein